MKKFFILSLVFFLSVSILFLLVGCSISKPKEEEKSNSTQIGRYRAFTTAGGAMIVLVDTIEGKVWTNIIREKRWIYHDPVHDPLGILGEEE